MNLIDALVSRGWTVKRAKGDDRLLPPALAARYPVLPSAASGFLSSLRHCHNAAQDAWFLTAVDYGAESNSGFNWNEYERMALEAASTDSAKVGIITFWNQHFPFMMAVNSDYDYLALRLTKDEFGVVVHGLAPEWEEAAQIAPSFDVFLQRFAEAAASPSPEYPLDVFLGT